MCRNLLKKNKTMIISGPRKLWAWALRLSPFQGQTEEWHAAAAGSPPNSRASSISAPFSLIPRHRHHQAIG